MAKFLDDFFAGLRDFCSLKSTQEKRESLEVGLFTPRCIWQVLKESGRWSFLLERARMSFDLFKPKPACNQAQASLGFPNFSF